MANTIVLHLNQSSVDKMKISRGEDLVLPYSAIVAKSIK